MACSWPLSTTPSLTFVPDNNFESRLIDYGYDDVMDDSVLTNMISENQELHIGFMGISDLTGIEDKAQPGYLSL